MSACTVTPKPERGLRLWLLLPGTAFLITATTFALHGWRIAAVITLLLGADAIYDATYLHSAAGSRLTVTDTALTVRVGLRTVTWRWQDIEHLTIGGGRRTRLRARFRDGRTATVDLSHFCPATHFAWGRAILEQVERHHLGMSRADRNSLDGMPYR